MATRGLRAAVFAALCVLLAAGSHALATGAAPSARTQFAAGLAVFTAAALRAGRERSLTAIGGGTLTSQAGLHLAFDVTRPHTTTVVHAVRPHTATVVHAMRTTHTHALLPHATTTHIGAALILTWWLRRGEAALWSLLRRAAAFVPGLAAWWRAARGAPAAANPPGAVRPTADGARSPRPVRLRHAVHRRGPPTGTSYAL
ncbi:hypothetical protein ABZ330_29855 [Streptomyces sp. NPDC006172]|uniref:hypothetical protein n=1 Tax=Streptomyces sp. NPDC006172 TaxID=3154470 RepID=UPI00340E2606